MSRGLSIFAVIAVLVGCCAGDLDVPLQLLRTNPAAESHQGTEYVLGFIRPDTPSQSLPNAQLYISTQDPRGADVTVAVPRAEEEFERFGFPMNFRIEQFETRTVVFPTQNGGVDIRVQNEFDRGISVISNNGAKLDIIGVNDDVRSNDAFVALPCKLSEEGNYHVSQYKYFIFSAFPEPGTSSRFMLIPCTTGGPSGNDGIRYVLPADRTPANTQRDNELRTLGRYETVLIQQPFDLTGTVIISDYPLAVFAGHECGLIPDGVTACDTLVEQIPPDITYGSRFFVLPFAVRESGDIIRIGSTVDNNEVSVTCTRRQADGTFQVINPPVTTSPSVTGQTINEGGVLEFQTLNRISAGLSTENYRRDYCCIETSKPAIVMQYMLGHFGDRVVFNEIPQIGDPAMSLVPPVEQYKNDYIIVTPDDVLTTIGGAGFEFESFMGWVIPSEFFNLAIGDDSNFFVNNATFRPTGRASGGSGNYVEIRCRNGQVCGYGGVGSIPSGIHQVSYRSPRDANAAMYTSVYGLHREISYAYPGGFECEPIGLPYISTYDVVVTEGTDDFARIVFNRTGGNLELATRIVAFTVQTTEGGAQETSDFIPITRGSNRRIIFETNQVNPRMRTARDMPFDVTIVDDEIPEPPEEFEVHFFVDGTFSGGSSQPGGYAFPTSIARVTILDNDGGTQCSLVNTMYTVTESAGAFIDVVVRTTDVGDVGQSCVLTTEAGTAMAGSDYEALTSFPVMFTGSQQTVRINIVDDDAVENPEMFTVRLSSTNPSDVEITGSPTATVTINDPDRVRFRFEQPQYAVNEDSGPAELVIVKEGTFDQDIDLNFATSDGTAIAPGDYTSTSRVITFPAGQTRFTVPVPIISDSVYELDETFSAMISEVMDQAFVEVTQPMTQVVISNDDRIKIGFDPVEYLGNAESVGTVPLRIVQFDRAPGINLNVSVNFNTMDDTAEAGSDYTFTSQPLIFGNGVTALMVNVPIINDDMFERSPDEIFFGLLSLGAGQDDFAEIVNDRATVGITDDEAPPPSAIVQFNPTAYPAIEGETITFMLMLSEAVGESVTVDVQIIEDTATDPEDFFATANVTVTFAPGETTASFEVPTISDTEDEGDETFFARISDATGATVGPNDEATATISDPLVVQFDPVTYSTTEGMPASLTIVLSSASDDDVTVVFSTVDNTAAAPDDFPAVVDMVLTIPAGQTSLTFQVQTQDDSIAENDEIFNGLIASPSEGVRLGNDFLSSITINDNDDLTVMLVPVVSSVEEGGSITLMAVLSNPADREITVMFDTQPDSADESDYTPVSTTLTFAAGQTMFSIPISTTADGVSELQESFSGVLSNPSPGLTIQGPSATINILQQALEVELSPATAQVDEGDDTTLTATLSMPADRPVTVRVQTRGGTANAPGDYMPVDTILTFLAGETTQMFTISTAEDDVSEMTENFEAFLSAPTNGLTLGAQSSSTIEIIDDDALSVSFNPTVYDVAEGSMTLLMAVLSNPSDREVTVMFNTQPDSADESDYTPVSTTLTFPAGETTISIPISATSDGVSELQESFSGVLSNPSSGVTIQGPSATINILPQPLEVELSPATAQVDEGDDTTLTATLSMPADRPVTVRVQTRAGTAEAPGDYMPVDTILTFLAGETTQMVTISTVEDDVSELTENFEAFLSGPTNGLTLGAQSSSTIEIIDDDAVSVSFNPTVYDVAEGNMTILMVVLSNPSDREVTVMFNTQPDSADESDYTPVSTILTFPAGETTLPIPISITRDGVSELQESFSGVLSNPSSGVTIQGPPAIINILPQPLQVDLTPATARVIEGGDTTLTATLSMPADRPVTIRVQTRDGTAEAPSDYTTQDMILTFPAGETSQTITISTTEDDTPEVIEDFEVFLSEPTDGLALGPQTSTTVEVIDDDMVMINFAPTMYNPSEGDTATLTVVLSRPSDREVTVDVATSPETALENEDYIPQSTTLTFAPGETTATLDVPIVDDEINEVAELFNAELSNPSMGAALGPDDTATINIMDDDLAFIQFGRNTYQEDEGDQVILEIVMDRVADRDIGVLVRTFDDTAGSPDDYEGVSQTVFIPAGQTSITVPVPTVDDQIAEPDERFTALLSNASIGAMVVPGPPSMASATIVDDEELRPSVESSDYRVPEPNGFVETCVVLNVEASETVTVRGRAGNADPVDASDGMDYVGGEADFVFPPGVTRACLNITIIDDNIAENEEEVLVAEIVSIDAGDIPVQPGDIPSATVTIIDDDDLRVFIEDPSYSVVESEGPLEVCLELNYAADQPFTAEVDIRENNPPDARDGVDFIAEIVSVTFPVGSQRECVNVTIVDNDIVEPLEEEFTIEVTPSEPNPYRATAGPNSMVPVTIVDDDEVRVSIDQPQYTVNEDDGTVEVCVRKDGITTQSITVDIATSDGSATASMDYTAIMTSVTLLPAQTRACVNIPITDDPVAFEGDETFNVSISTPPDVPSGGPSVVTIIDDDIIELNFDEPTISVREDIPGGVRQVCFTPSAPSARPYSVGVARAPTPPNPATPGDDYTVNMQDLMRTIPAGNPMQQCIDVGIVNDNVTLELDETFTFSFATIPNGAVRGSDPESEVTIVDDDSTVVLVPNNPTVTEGEPPEEFCVDMALPAAQDVVFEVVINADQSIHFAPTSFTLTIPAGDVRACMNIVAIDDKIALEDDFTAPATVTIISPSITPSSFSASVTLVDNDDLSVAFERTVYMVEEGTDSQAETCLNLNCPAARDVSVTISAKQSGEAIDGDDYRQNSQTVVFPAGQQRMCGSFVIIDDSVVERLENFTVCIEDATPGVGTSPGPSTTTVVIEDDDEVSVRVEEPNYRVNESDGGVEVCVRRVGQSADPITVILRTMESTPPEAIDGEDFNIFAASLTIQPTVNRACVLVPITDDDLAMEGEEDFIVVVDPPESIPVPPPSIITIIDDDVVEVFFTTPEVTVPEDVGSSQVCINSRTESARPYDVTLSRMPSGSNPASPGDDYTIVMSDQTVTFPAGSPVEQCVPFNIVDDNLAQEGNETFQFDIQPAPRIRPVDPDSAVVTIIENDLTVEVNFVTNDVTVNENNGTVFVCLERDRLTENDLTVPIVISDGSADSTDHGQATEVTFSPQDSMACASIPITNDNTQEVPENFRVGFGQTPPGTVPGSLVESEVTIIDDDEPQTQCTIRDSMVVRPFNNSVGYTFRGSCELVVIESNNNAELDFSVRIDFLTDTNDLGAVGVHKDEFVWVSREDGEFVGTSPGREDLGNSIFYRASDITIILNATARINTIIVGDGIGVTIIHNYGADEGSSVTFAVESGTSLVQTRGVCGTQNGDVIDRNGFVATTPEQRRTVAESYRTEARYQSLRPIRRECTRLQNDTVIGDPLYTVPYLGAPNVPDRSLCYEVHGRPNTHFNLVSDECVSVNALYSGVTVRDSDLNDINLNIISSIGIKAQDNEGNCRDVRVDLNPNQCSISTGISGEAMVPLDSDMNLSGVYIRKKSSNRVRVSVPNCDNVQLIMWVICERGQPVDMIRFHISRGINLRPTSHGLLGQFWNVDVCVEPFTPPPGSNMEHDADKLFNVTVVPPNRPTRSFLGDLFPRTWDNSRKECLYVGNGQGGPSAEFDSLKGSVIEGRYRDYVVNSLFETDFEYDRIGDCAVQSGAV